MIGIQRHKLKLAVAMALAATALYESGLPPAEAQSAKTESSVSTQARALIAQAIASTGLILVRNSSDTSGPRPRGSAVVIRSDGVIATNQHVVTSDRTNKLYDEILFTLSRDGDPNPGTSYRLKPLLISREYDLALLAVEGDRTGKPLPRSFTFPSVEIGDSRKIKLLEDLFIIGFPEKGGSTITINRGVVEGKDALGGWIKTDARVIHGNSGGAAVNSEGKLIGIPTKVVADEQPIDKDGDGFPDGYRRFGAVGFLRPSYLITEMLNRLGENVSRREMAVTPPAVVETSKVITVRGMVRSAGKPVAGVLVGLLPLGETEVSESTLLTWGSTNADGEFKLNRPVPPGRYTLKAKPLTSQPYTRDVEIAPGGPALIIDLHTPPSK